MLHERPEIEKVGLEISRVVCAGWGEMERRRYGSRVRISCKMWLQERLMSTPMEVKRKATPNDWLSMNLSKGVLSSVEW